MNDKVPTNPTMNDEKYYLQFSGSGAEPTGGNSEQLPVLCEDQVRAGCQWSE